MPAAAIAGPVAAWLGGSATAAVIGAAVAGAVYGAIIGAATSLITGGNVLKGALTGAAIGGVTAGVLQGVGAIDFVGATASAATPSAATPELTTAANQSLAQQTGVGAGSAPANTSSLLHTGPRTGSGGAGAPISAAAGGATKEAMTPATANLIGGAVSGVGSGMGKVGAAMIESDAREEELERMRGYEIDRVNRNVPGVVPKSTMVVTLPQRWNALADISSFIKQYQKPLDQSQGVGLLEEKAA